jgi:2-iminobutanoate/2-iminopropanoate deaminase
MAKEIYEAFEGQQDAFGYSQATKVGDTIYVAGTPGVGEGFHIPESMAEQMELAYQNVAATLAHFGATMADVVEQRVYVTSIDEAAAALEVRKAAYGGKDLPASTMVEVSRLALPQLKFEVAVIARVQA